MNPNDDPRYLGRSVTSLQTMLRVIALEDRHCPGVIPDGIYGQQTARAVAWQQKLAGLPQTGVTDLPTWEAICRAYERAWVQIQPAAPLEIVLDPDQVILEGSCNRHVLLIQAMLRVLHQVYDNVEDCPLTGIWDGDSCRALRSLQGRCGLPQSGILDKGLWALLAGLYHQAVGNGEPKSGNQD